MISRRVAVTVLVIACVPWAWLLLYQAVAIFLLLVVVSAGDLGACLDNAVLPTLAMVWLACAPLPLGILAALTGLRHSRGAAWLGLALMLVGLPLCVVSVDRVACPARVMPFDDASEGSVPVPDLTVAAVVVFLACFGVLAWSAWRHR